MTARPSTIPLYSLSDISRYARAQTDLVHRLDLGYRDDETERPPLLRSWVDPREPAPYSFDDLIETAVIAALRSKGVSSRRYVRRIVSLQGRSPMTRSPGATS